MEYSEITFRSLNELSSLIALSAMEKMPNETLHRIYLKDED